MSGEQESILRIFQDVGTRYMKAKPFMRPALRDQAASLDAFVSDLEGRLNALEGTTNHAD